MKIIDILKRHGVPAKVVEEVEAELAKPPLSPWWNSKERLEKELGRKLER